MLKEDIAARRLGGKVFDTVLKYEAAGSGDR
jgi:hypothetical protein